MRCHCRLLERVRGKSGMDIGATLSTVGRAQRCQTHAPDLSGEALLRLTSDTAGCFTYVAHLFWPIVGLTVNI